jgi:transposase-like protein
MKAQTTKTEPASYDPEYRARLVARVHAGETMRSLAKEGPSITTIQKWVAEAALASGNGHANGHDANEVDRLRSQVRELTEERDALKRTLRSFMRE